MTAYFAPTALLPDGWAENVRIETDQAGFIVSVAPGVAEASATKEGAIMLGGPVVPGMIDLHCHAFQHAMAGLAEKSQAGADSFWTWRQTMYRFAEALTPDHLAAIAGHLYIELLRHGYTSVAEFHYLHHAPGGGRYDDPAELSLTVVDAADRAGIGLTHLPVLYCQGGFDGLALEPGQRRFANDPAAFLEIVERVRACARGNPQLRVGVAPHSLRAVGPQALGEVVTAIKAFDPDMPVHIHAAETAREVEDCLAWSGLRPVEWLLENAGIDEGWCLVHATQAGDGELAAMARRGVVAGLCPTTEANLGDGVFALAPYLAAGGSFGIGSDANLCTDPAEELRWLEYGQRLGRRERAVAARPEIPSTGESLYRAALEGGRRACGRAVGRIEAGARADLVALDPDSPALAARRPDQILDGLLFAATDTPVRHVVAGGRQVVTDGRHQGQEAAAGAYRQTLAELLV